MVAQEDFFDKDAASSWKGEKDLASLTTTSCAGIQMLGGHGAFDRAGSVTKTFKELGAHTKVRVTGTFHFIDKWSSQSGFMKMSGVGEGEELKPQ